PPVRDVPPAPRLEGRGALAELDSARVAQSYGVPYVPAERCADPDQAVDAAERIGYPVVVKIDNVAHKARVGGVALNLFDAAQVRGAAALMEGPVIVAEQASGGVEVLVGMVRDPDFGPTMVAGVGGGLAEPLDLVSATLAPLDHEGARELVKSLPALDRLLGPEVPPGLLEAIVAVSRLAAEHPEIVEIDVNPLLVSPERTVALDCLIVLGSPTKENEA
ncbi:MAG: acetate--CoA ligase family protein, partial [Gaiellales bacterium]